MNSECASSTESSSEWGQRDVSITDARECRTARLTCFRVTEVRQHETDDHEAKIQAIGTAWGESLQLGEESDGDDKVGGEGRGGGDGRADRANLKCEELGLVPAQVGVG